MGASLIIWNKQMRKFFIHKEESLGMLIQPILWVVLFGVGMRALMTNISPSSGDAYITFLLPGIITLTTVSSAIAGGAEWLNERLTGLVKEYLVAPIPRISILFGNALTIITKALVQSMIILFIGLLFGASLSQNPIGWLGGLFLVLLYGIGFSGIALAVASKSGSIGGYHMLIFMLQLPLLFWSNSLYPLSDLPFWMKVGALANPTTYVVTGMRYLTTSTTGAMVSINYIPLWLCFPILIGFASVGMILALKAFTSSIN